MKKVLTSVLFFVLFATEMAFCSDWPRFRGDLQNSGISNETGMLTSWPEGGPELLWSIEGKLGVGWSSCAVVDNVIYTAGMDNASRKGILYAISETGEILWQKEFGQEWIKSYKGSRGTPTVVDGKVYIMTGNGLASCFNAKDGSLIWQVDLVKEYGVKLPFFGLSESILVIDGKAICTPGSEKACMVALNAADGKELWKSKSLGNDSVRFCSASYITHKNQNMVVTLLSDMAAAFDPANGDLLWTIKYDEFEGKGAGMGGDTRANSPIYSDGKIILSAGYDKGTLIAELADDARSVKNVKCVEKFDNQHHGQVVHNGYLYGSTWDGNEAGHWLCMEIATGDIKYDYNWNSGKGMVIAADGYLYCYNEKLGKLALVKADPSGFNIAGSVDIKGSGEHWAHPAISNGKLFVRHGDALFVYKIAK